MSCYLPLLREFVPRAAKEIEADHIHSSIPPEEEYLYDCYSCYGTVSEEMGISSKNQFPLVQVQDGEEDCFCSGSDDESEYDSEDSNAEGYAMNEYPEGNVREMSETSDESQDERRL
uniref:RNA-directed DNA methylation 4 n=1 Tax=Noccaea caerulescens TaxID=107243 RepID=A0A1J3HB56_NOCCA